MGTKFIGLFPLKMVVFPGEMLNLHIFEPRYRQLISECNVSGMTFGIPAFMDNHVQEIGTEVKILKIEKVYPDKSMDVRTLGLRTFKILDFYNYAEGKLYSGADIEQIDLNQNGNLDLNLHIFELVRKLLSIMNIEKRIPNEPSKYTLFDVAHYVGFSIDQEYEFLCLPDELSRQAYMMEHLKGLIPIATDMEKLRQRALLNGHFKNISGLMG
jgi:hypothetical protein